MVQSVTQITNTPSTAATTLATSLLTTPWGTAIPQGPTLSSFTGYTGTYTYTMSPQAFTSTVAGDAGTFTGTTYLDFTNGELRSNLSATISQISADGANPALAIAFTGTTPFANLTTQPNGGIRATLNASGDLFDSATLAPKITVDSTTSTYSTANLTVNITGNGLGLFPSSTDLSINIHSDPTTASLPADVMGVQMKVETQQIGSGFTSTLSGTNAAAGVK